MIFSTAKKEQEARLPSDAILMSRLREGDLAAVEPLFQKYASSLLALAAHITGSKEDAEDIVQDVFVGLPVSARAYIEAGQLERWLRRVTVRMCLMAMRRDRNRRQVGLDHVQPTDPSLRMLSQITLSEAVRNLPSTLRTVFVLKEIGHYTHAEIGSMLGIRPGTSEVRLFRAVRILRKILKAST